ncbi:MAG: hypothetical protein ACPGOV_10170 [Magnetovibrionaceae bacterium]
MTDQQLYCKVFAACLKAAVENPDSARNLSWFRKNMMVCAGEKEKKAA